MDDHSGMLEVMVGAAGSGRQQVVTGDEGKISTCNKRPTTAKQHHSTIQPTHLAVAATTAGQETEAMQPALVVATTTAGREFAAMQPALVVTTTTAGQEFAFAQHDGNQLTGNSSTQQELSDMEEVTVDAAVKQVERYRRTQTASRQRKKQKWEKQQVTK